MAADWVSPALPEGDGFLAAFLRALVSAISFRQHSQDIADVVCLAEEAVQAACSHFSALSSRGVVRRAERHWGPPLVMTRKVP